MGGGLSFSSFGRRCCGAEIFKPHPLISEKLAFLALDALSSSQKSQRETTIGMILRVKLRVKLKDKDYERTKTTSHIKWRVPVLIRVPI